MKYMKLRLFAFNKALGIFRKLTTTTTTTTLQEKLKVKGV